MVTSFDYNLYDKQMVTIINFCQDISTSERPKKREHWAKKYPLYMW